MVLLVRSGATAGVAKSVAVRARVRRMVERMELGHTRAHKVEGGILLRKAPVSEGEYALVSETGHSALRKDFG